MIRITVTLFSLLFSALSFAEPQVWQAQNGNLTFTIFGSVHAGKTEFYPLPSELEERFLGADGLIVEADIIKDTSISLPKGKPSSFYLNDAQQKSLMAISSEVAMPATVLLSLPPWQTAMALQLHQVNRLELQQELGIDVHFLSRAHTSKLPVFPLETVQQQVNLLTNADDDGLELLTETISYWDISKELMPCLIDAWQYGDGEKMEEMLVTMSSGGEFERQLIDKRNDNWVEILTAPSRFSEGDYVVVVGALHLYGERGLLALLEDAGFNLSLLTEGRKVDCETPAISR